MGCERFGDTLPPMPPRLIPNAITAIGLPWLAARRAAPRQRWNRA